MDQSKSLGDGVKYRRHCRSGPALPAGADLPRCQFPCVGVWFWFGDLLKHLILGTPWERHLNRSLAVLLALSMLMMI